MLINHILFMAFWHRTGRSRWISWICPVVLCFGLTLLLRYSVNVSKDKWSMEMIIPNHSICYFYYDFSVFVFIILFGSIRKIMSYRFILFAFNLIDHQYSICRMYLEENSQVFRFLVSYLLSLRVSNAVFECWSCI